MTAINPPNPVKPARQQARRLRQIGTGLLLLGGSIAGLVYWLGMRSAAPMDDLAMQGFNRVEQQQMNQLFGGAGGLIEDGATALKQPGTQAMLIVVAAGVLAAGCFYFAHRQANEDAGANQNDSPS